VFWSSDVKFNITSISIFHMNQDNSVITVTGYEVGGWLGFDFCQGERLFSLLPCSNWVWSLPSILSSECMRLSMDVKWAEHETDLSPPSTAQVKNVWSCTSTLLLLLHDVVHKHRGSITFAFYFAT